MKKMKRFLSLLICMVMLMSVLPMGASAAHVHDWRGEFTFINDDPSGHYYDCNYCDYTTEKEDHWFYVGEWYGTYYDGSECFTCHYKKPQTYNITYMDGTTKLTDLTPATYTEGTGATLPGADKVTKLGYTFAGWYNNDTLTDGPVTEIPADASDPKTFYADWDIVTYNITYDLGEGGALAEGVTNPDTYTIETADFTLNNPQREGYIFTGWTGSNGETAQETVTIAQGSTGPKSYTANWEKVATHEVRFHGPFNGYVSPVVETKTVEHGKTVNAEGVTVAGYLKPTKWYTLEPNVYWGWDWIEYDFSTPVDDDLDLFVREWIEAVTVTFDANGHGTAPTAQTIGKGANAANPGAPKDYNATAYTFDGWYKGVNKFDFAKEKVEQSITLKAKWTVNPFTISYELNGGALAEGVTNPTGYNFESAPIELNNPTKAGYTFAGWEGTGIEGKQTTVTIPTGSTGNREYTATWTPIEYTITYKLDGGELEEGKENPATYNVESAEITLNNPEKAGYTFAGWIETGVEGKQTTVTIPTGSTGNREYTATWTPIEYTITYKLDGGELEEGKENPATYNVESAEITLNNPEKAGYTFAGWVETGVEGKKNTVTIPTGSTGNREYTATWTVETYEISYDLDGGSLAADKKNPATYTIETEDFTLNNPTKADYTFAGWSGTDIEGAKIDVTIKKGSTGGRKYTANWTLTPVVVGIDVKPDDKQIYVGETQQFTAEVEIIGNIGKEVTWSVAPASGIALLSADETSIDENTGLLTANKPGKYIVTATSRSNPNVYGTEEIEVLPLLTVKFDTNGKGTAPADQNLKAGEKAVKPADPTAANYTFGGWYADKDCTIAYVFDTEVETNITLYAKWTKTIYKVTYDANGGTGEMPVVNVEAGEGHTLVANEFKAPTGKTFKCWKVGLKEYKAGEKIDVTENVTVKAVWKNKTASSDLDYVPAAGDNFPTFLWAGLLLFSVVALVEVVVLRRKRS